MIVVVAVPYRPDGSWRDQLWHWCRPIWERVGTVIESAGPPGPFNRAAAINTALRDSWDVAVIVDADTVAPTGRVVSAAHWHATPNRLVLPYRQRLLLTEEHTRNVLATEPAVAPLIAAATHGATREPYKAFRSGVVVVHRELWELVGGYDERFVGWGGEDDAFADACEALGSGPAERLDGDIYHLWHPSARPDDTDPQFVANRMLAARYRRVRRSRDKMVDLINERGTL